MLAIFKVSNIGIADCGMKTIVLCGENPCRDAKFRVSTSKIHTSIQQHRNILLVKNIVRFDAFDTNLWAIEEQSDFYLSKFDNHAAN
jgi:hypothetical protein